MPDARNQRDQFKVGLTVVVVLALFVGVLVFIGQWDALFAKTRYMTVRFKHQDGIQGLRVKDPVRVGGVNQGKVRKIWLQSASVTDQSGAEREELFVYVLAELPAWLEFRADDCKVTIGTKFVGEGGTLDILDRGSSGPLIGPDDVIEGSAPEGFAQLTSKLSREFDETRSQSLLAQIKSQLDLNAADSLMAKIHRSVDDINSVTASLVGQFNQEDQNALLAKIHKSVDHINAITSSLHGELDAEEKSSVLAGMHTALDSLNASLESVRSLIEQGQPKISTAIDHVQAAARRLDEDISKTVADELRGDVDGTLLTKLHNSMDQAAKAMDNLEQMTGAGKNLLVMNREKIQLLVDNFQETSQHLKATAKELRRNPWRLLHKPEKPEREYQNLLDTARAFADAASCIDDAARKLSGLAEAKIEALPADDPQLVEIRQKLATAFEKFGTAEQAFWKRLRR